MDDETEAPLDDLEVVDVEDDTSLGDGGFTQQSCTGGRWRRQGQRLTDHGV